MKAKPLVVLMAAAALLGACQGTGPKTAGGTLVGAGTGALIGSQFGGGEGQLAAVAIGTLVGAFVGNEVGQSLDRADQLHAQQATQQVGSVPLGQPVTWSNPNSGNSGTITPVRQGTNTQTGAYCREFEQQITVDGRTQVQRGTACQQPDGSWQVI